MTTNQIFAELTRRILAGGNISDDYPYELGDIYPHLDFAYSNAVKFRSYEIYQENRYHSVDPGITKEYELDVDRSGSRPKLNLPVSIVRLPHELGVYQVRYKENVFARTKPDYVDVFQSLITRSVSSKPKFYVEGNAVYFFDLPTQVKCLSVKLVPLPSSLDPDDEVLFPAGSEDRIIDTVLQRMGMSVNIPEDRSNDNKK